MDGEQRRAAGRGRDERSRDGCDGGSLRKEQGCSGPGSTPHLAAAGRQIPAPPDAQHSSVFMVLS